MPNGDAEMQKPQFYEDNKYWLVEEVDKYLDKNKNDIKEEEMRQQQELERQKQEEERLEQLK